MNELNNVFAVSYFWGEFAVASRAPEGLTVSWFDTEQAAREYYDTIPNPFKADTMRIITRTEYEEVLSRLPLNIGVFTYDRNSDKYYETIIR